MSASSSPIEDLMMVQSIESVHDLPLIRDHIDSVAREILQIIIIQKSKTVKDINKIFQATLSNYFFECYVCGLLVENKFGAYETKSEAKKRIEYPLKKLNKDCSNEFGKIPKYISLIQIYNEEVSSKGLDREYIALLSDIVKGNSELESQARDVFLADKTSKKYATIFQKKLCALLVLESFLSRHSIEIRYKNFNELWNGVFRNFRINYFAREQNIIMGKIAVIESFLPTNSQSLQAQQSQSSSSRQIIEKVAQIKSIQQSSPNKTSPYCQLLTSAISQSNFVVTSNFPKQSRYSRPNRDIFNSSSNPSFSSSNDLEDELRYETQLSNTSQQKYIKQSQIVNIKRKHSDNAKTYQNGKKQLKTVSFSALSGDHSFLNFEIVQSVGSSSFLRESSFSSLQLLRSQTNTM